MKSGCALAMKSATACALPVAKVSERLAFSLGGAARVVPYL